MARKTTRTKALAPATPPAPAKQRREVPAPAWHRPYSMYGHTYRYTMRQLVTAEDFVLPPFQRDLVWSAEMQAAFCNTIFDGLPTGICLVWRRYVDGKPVRVVLDGQQRLAAIGARVLRADGTPNPGTRAYFDLATGRFGTDPGRWALTMPDLANLRFSHHMQVSDALEEAGDLEGYDLWYGSIFAHDMLGGRELSFFEVEHDTPPEVVVEAFRSINRPGIPFDLAEVERLVAAVAGISW